MPDLLFKLCPKCGRVMPVGRGDRLCPECSEKESRRVRKRDWKKEYAARASSENPEIRRFYRSKQWRMTSRKYAQTVGYRCEECGDIGTDVHHIEPVQTDSGWERRYDFSNLRLLCVRCHNEAHGRTFRNGWGDSDAFGKAEEAAGDADGLDEQGEQGEEGGHRGFPRVSDYRV